MIAGCPTCQLKSRTFETLGRLNRALRAEPTDHEVAQLYSFALTLLSDQTGQEPYEIHSAVVAYVDGT